MKNSKKISLLVSVILFSSLVWLGFSLISGGFAGLPPASRSAAQAPLLDSQVDSATSDRAANLSAATGRAKLQSTQQVEFEPDQINSTTLTQAAPDIAAPAGCEVSTHLEYETSLLDLVNQERANAGLPALTRQNQLDLAATEHNADVACNNFFSHTGSDGSSPFDRIHKQGYTYLAAGENLYAGSGLNDDPTAAIDAWMKSPGHRANVLNQDYIEIGVSYIYAPDSTYKGYYAVTFGEPQ